MIAPELLYEALRDAGVEYFSGVPDSLLKTFCAYVTDNMAADHHVIAANEGAALALAIGYHLGSGKVPLVYLQNSGLGNLVNPLTSLADSEVYGIPMLLMIGWRGEPGVPDEPQHTKQGRITLGLLDSLEIPYTVLDGSESDVHTLIGAVADSALARSGPHALVIKKGAIGHYQASLPSGTDYGWSRESAIAQIVGCLEQRDILVATTGMASRELFEYREAHKQTHEGDFLTVGGMGHASQIALGIASQKPDRRIVCLDGDGAVLMHLGSLATNGVSGLKNFKHIILNNGAHDSVGGQPTVALDISLPQVAMACGYRHVWTCAGSNDINRYMQDLLHCAGPALLEVRVNKGSRSDLGRPTSTPRENKHSFMKFLRS